MEFFNKAKTVRLKSHLDKFLVADEDEQTVRQSRNGVEKKARWTVEFVERNPHLIRLKSSYGKYLTASDEPLFLTGKKVVQTNPEYKKDPSIEWEPIKDGYKVKLRTKEGKFLRANGATPPWRNSITHDLPHRTATQDWVLWEVDTMEISTQDHQIEYLQNSCDSPSSSISSFSDDFSGSSSIRSVSSPSGSCKASVFTNGEISSSPAASSKALNFTNERNSPLSLSNKKNTSLIIRGSKRQEGMEFFDKAKSVRLQSSHGKYLVADEDEETVKQSRNGASKKSRWTVEFVDGKPNVIRLKSCHGRYLTAVDKPFLLGASGKKVLQTIPAKLTDTSIEWEPVKEGLHVKLMTNRGKFLRANWGPPPYKNSVTHDIPHRTATQEWILWGVDIVDITLSDAESEESSLSPASSFNSLQEEYPYSPSPDTGSPVPGFTPRTSFSVDWQRDARSIGYSRMRDKSLDFYQQEDAAVSIGSPKHEQKQSPGMEFFKRAKSVRLKSHHDKFLLADSDEETVTQDRSGTSKHAKWTVEFVEGVENVVRLKSCYGKYLTASDEHFLLGVTGEKVIQSLPRKLDSKVEWEPIREGVKVKLRTRYGNFLRANGGLPPWRNSITHDIPHRHQDWILWEIDVVEIRPETPKKVERSESLDDDLSNFHLRTPSQQETLESFGGSPMKYEGRMIYYHVADDDGNVNDAVEGQSFNFKGHNVEELTRKLEEETELQSITVCSKNKINGKLYPLRLGLPPNNATMHVVVVPSTCKG
ncbi:OLC1v1009467C3 [Oldenlandia corymbosa var. corymbosa]|uniref:OLC1v1009467C3 n=1 Tax=Oldenlandia corymbosa var. corymbosa TaxID=529605 RepID=A0AAV1DP35_OLDCO|nr:OLC1v1009467C3 [Oldenlandia corymbosa var. corymbosa]